MLYLYYSPLYTKTVGIYSYFDIHLHIRVTGICTFCNLQLVDIQLNIIYDKLCVKLSHAKLRSCKPTRVSSMGFTPCKPTLVLRLCPHTLVVIDHKSQATRCYKTYSCVQNGLTMEELRRNCCLGIPHYKQVDKQSELAASCWTLHPETVHVWRAKSSYYLDNCIPQWKTVR